MEVLPMGEGSVTAMDIIASGSVRMVVKAVVELGVLEILANAGAGEKLSASEIVSQLPTESPNAAETLDRILHFLASYSILSCTGGSNGARRYGLTPVCHDFLHDEDGIPCASLIMGLLDRNITKSLDYLKDAVLEGCVPLTKAHGMTMFELFSKNARLGKLFNESMFIISTGMMKHVLENYRGFEELKEVVDVGGGVGASLRLVISKYPHLKGINFDLPHVVATAVPIPGVKHVGGDMFENVPTGDAIILKWVLHDWDIERSVKILRNCWKALPDSGKVIIIEYVLPTEPHPDKNSRLAIMYDVVMLALTEGGRERTVAEFNELAKMSGFPTVKVFPMSNGMAVIEFYKTP